MCVFESMLHAKCVDLRQMSSAWLVSFLSPRRHVENALEKRKPHPQLIPHVGSYRFPCELWDVFSNFHRLFPLLGTSTACHNLKLRGSHLFYLHGVI